MNLQELYNDFGIITSTESDKHYRDGWINTSCPFCKGSEGFHLGFNTSGNYFSCYRCGYNPTIKTLMALLKLPLYEIKKLLQSYKGSSLIKTPNIKVRRKAFKTPSYLKPIAELPINSKYLKNRGFDPFLLENKYQIKGTSHFSSLDKIDYRFRIFIPIFFEGQLVSWQTRDITDLSNVKYLSCPLKRELTPHKEILYQFPNTNYIVLCEGVFDVWKIEMAGFPSTCCFGIEYKLYQLKWIMRYKKIIIFFDSEPQAQKKALELQRRLEFMGKEIINICPPKGEDAGSLTIKKIKRLLK